MGHPSQVDGSLALETLRREADAFLLNGHNNKNGDAESLAADGCAFDAMEDVCLPPTHAVRRDLETYCRYRFRSEGPLGCFEPAHRKAFCGVLSKLAKFVAPLFDTLSRDGACKSGVQKRGTVLYLVNEHYVIKPPRSNVSFSWHTDAGEQFTGRHPPPYVSVWLPLDDVSQGNGTLQIIPWSRQSKRIVASDGMGNPSFEAGSKSRNKKRKRMAEEATTSTLATPEDTSIGIDTRDSCLEDTWRLDLEHEPASIVEAKAGSAVVFSSKLWHASGPNVTDSPRRVYYAQFSTIPITAANCKRAKSQNESRDANEASPPLCYAVDIPLDC